MNDTSLQEWWDLILPLIDVRETQGNNAIASTERVVVHLPLSTLLSGERSCELPPRNVEFGIMLEEVQDEAEGKCRQQRLQSLFFATSSKGNAAVKEALECIRGPDCHSGAVGRIKESWNPQVY